MKETVRSSKNGLAVFIGSTGRCSTQALARSLALADPRTIVEHEPLRAGYKPALVFRKKSRAGVVKLLNPKISRKYNEIALTINSGIRYVDTGWPIFAWLPYLEQTWKAKMIFIHLVRNPFATAASLLTHNFFLGRQDEYQRYGIIKSTDKNIYFKQFSARYNKLTSFEKLLVHWLEVNQFLIELHKLAQFRGLFKFEDIFKENCTKHLNELMSTLAGQPITQDNLLHYDKHKHILKSNIEFKDKDIFQACLSLSGKLGYNPQNLENTLRSGKIFSRYDSRNIKICV